MRLVVFQRRKGWYWRLVARNNRILAIGGEPFSSARAAIRSMFIVTNLATTHPRIPFEEIPLRKGRRRR